MGEIMKKLCLVLVMVLMASVVWADCTVTVNITSSSDPNAATHETWYDPDNTVGADEFIPAGCSGDMALTQCVFTIAAPAANDEVWIVTKNATETESYVSPKVQVGGIAGSVTSTVIVQCQ